MTLKNENFIRIQGKVIKVEPAHKTGYYLIIQQAETNKQKGVFSQWSYELDTNGLFTLRRDNKYWLITDYQLLSEPSLIKPTRTEETELNRDRAELHKNQENQEKKHEASQIKQLEARNEQLLKQNQELKNLLGNYISYSSFVFSQQIKNYQSKSGKKISQWDKEHLENCELLLNEIEQKAQELKTQNITVAHIFK